MRPEHPPALPGRLPPRRPVLRCALGAALPALVLALTACATTALQADLQACRAEVTSAIGSGDYQPSRMRRVDECMRKRGWRPTPACVETEQEGTGFCDYQR